MFPSKALLVGVRLSPARRNQGTCVPFQLVLSCDVMGYASCAHAIQVFRGGTSYKTWARCKSYLVSNKREDFQSAKEINQVCTYLVIIRVTVSTHNDAAKPPGNQSPDEKLA